MSDAFARFDSSGDDKYDEDDEDDEDEDENKDEDVSPAVMF